MAGPGIQLSIGANPQQILAAYNQLFQANVKLQQQFQQLANQQQRNHQQNLHNHSAAMHWAQEQVSIIKGVAVGWISVETVLHRVREAYKEINEAAKAAAESQARGRDIQVSSVLLSGKALNAEQVLAASGKSETLTKTESSSLFAAVHSGGPQLPTQRIAGIRDEIGKLLVAITEDEAKEIANVAGKLGSELPGKSSAEIASLTLALRQQAGEYFGTLSGQKGMPALRGLIRSGAFATPEDAIAWMAQAAEENPAIGRQLNQAIQETYERPHATKGMSRDEYQARLALFNAKTPEERMRAILSSPYAAEAAGVHGLGTFDSAAAKGISEQLKRASGDMSIDRQLAAIGATQEGVQKEFAREDILAKNRSEAPWGSERWKMDQANEILEEYLRKGHEDPYSFGSYMDSMAAKLMFFVFRQGYRADIPAGMGSDRYGAALSAMTPEGELGQEYEHRIQALDEARKQRMATEKLLEEVQGGKQGPAPVSPEKER